MKTTLKELMIRDLKKSGKVPRIIVTDDEPQKPNKPKKKKRTTPDVYVGGCGSLPRKGWCGDSYKDWYVCGKLVRQPRNIGGCGSIITRCGGSTGPRQPRNIGGCGSIITRCGGSTGPKVIYACGKECVIEHNYGCGGSISRGC